MTKRIFRSICLASLGVLAASVVLILGMLYNYFSNVQREQLKTETALVAQAITNEGSEYFDHFNAVELRITWISGNGTVLYDTETDSSKMENHMQREEIKQAVKNGYGESSRYSDTMTKRLYYAAQRLPDGSIVRLSVTQSSVPALIIGMIRPICIVFLAALALSLFLASRLSKRIVKPLNELDLENPLSNSEYDELSPLLRRIDKQQRQLRRQQRSLEHRREEFSAVTGNMNEGLILLNREGVILSINPAAARLLGTDKSCEGNNILTVDRSAAMQETVRNAANGKRFEQTVEIDGGRFHLEANPVYDKNEISGAAVILFDVTAAEQAEQMRREFTANVSHELKTPLQSVSGYAELISTGIAKPQDIPVFAKKIYSEAQRLIALVEDIIRLSKLDEGVSREECSSVELYAAVREVSEQLESQAEAAGVTVTVEGEPVTVSGEKTLINGIIYNLCDNAIKYNRPGGRVALSLESTENEAVLKVSDTGIGIPPTDRERVFERFYRVDKSHSKSIGGTGLGLSIVKHSVQAIGARISLESRLGEGTTVTVYFRRDN